MTPPIRSAARALIIDAANRVLLFRGVLPGREPWWFAPGGGLDEGETYEAAVVREVMEETGLVVNADEVGPAVWSRDYLFDWQGEVERHLERFFLIRVPTHDVDTTGFEPGEATVIREFRWWSIDDIRDSSERFSPSSIANLLTPLLRGDSATLPIEVGE
jgi:ADP-ribose pyrophosphatase YjhB (NUDIX family)